MASQKLRLEAEMKDGASPAIRKLREELAGLQATSAETRGTAKLNAEITQLASAAAVDGSTAVRKLRAELADLQKATAENRAITGLNKEIASLKKVSGEVSPTAGMKAYTNWMNEAGGKATGFLSSIKDIPGILGAVGVGGLGAGASIAGLASEMKKLGEQSLAMKELSRQTEISLDFVNRWSHAGEHFAVSGDAMSGMLDRFAGQLPDFNRGIGGMFKEFSQWPDVIRRMQHEGPAEALIDAFRQAEEVGKTKGPQVRKQFLDAIGLGGEAEKLFGDHGLSGLLTQLQKPWAGPSPEFLKQAQDLRDATIGFNNSLQQFENSSGPRFLETMRGIVDSAKAVVDYLNSRDWSKEEREQRKKIAEDSASKGENAFATGKLRLQKQEDTGVLPWIKNRLGLGDAPKASSVDPSTLPKFFHRSSYDRSGSGGLLQNASFTTGADPSSSSQFGLRGVMTESTKAGVVAAFREMMIDQSLKDKAGDGGGAGGEGGGGGNGGPGGGGSGVGSGGGSGGRRGFSLGDGGGTGSAGAGHKAVNNAELMKAAQEQLLKEGVSPDHVKAAAAALVGNVVQESVGDPNKVHDGGTGYGLYGARLGRRDNMLSWLAKNGFAKNSAEGQMKYMAHEAMTAKEYANSASALRLAQQSNLGAVTDAVARNFERPNERYANYGGRRNNAAAAFGADIGGGVGVAGQALKLGGDGTVLGGLEDMKRRGLISDQQCVTLGMAAVGIRKGVGQGGNVHDWRKGDAAEAGGLKKGTPISTFLDRQGRETDRYAGGGSGTPGAHLDHAGVFDHYTVDKNGRRTGFVMAEQYQGSGGVHMKAYGFHNGYGEGDGSHYHAIQTPDGRYLGGDRNPMSRRATDLAVAHPAAGRRAGNLGDTARERQQDASDHRLTIALHDPGGHVKSTRLERNGSLKVEMPNRWQTERNPLIGA